MANNIITFPMMPIPFMYYINSRHLMVIPLLRLHPQKHPDQLFASAPYLFCAFRSTLRGIRGDLLAPSRLPSLILEEFQSLSEPPPIEKPR